MRRAAAIFLVLTACPAPPAPEPPIQVHVVDDPIVARIGDEVVRRSDAERRVAMEIFRRRVDIHSLVARETDRIVEQRLLAREAASQGVTVEALLAKEVDTKVAPVTDEEVAAYLAENGLGEDRSERAAHYLSGRRHIERRLAFLDDLKKAANVTIDLQAPEMPRVDVDIEGAPARGPDDARVTIVHFGSFTDPHSAEIAKVVAEHRAKDPKAIREVFRPALRPRDELGLKAALLARRAAAKDDFWPVHDALFSKANALRQPDLQTIAAEHGLDADTIGGEADTAEIVALREELDIARKSGVTAPPVVFVNGRWFQHSFGVAKLEASIAAALVKPASSTVR